MGYWQTDAFGNSFAEEDTGLVWGDGPADLVADAVQEIVHEFREGLGRPPTKAELFAGFLFHLGRPVEGVVEDGTIAVVVHRNALDELAGESIVIDEALADILDRLFVGAERNVGKLANVRRELTRTVGDGVSTDLDGRPIRLVPPPEKEKE